MQLRIKSPYPPVHAIRHREHLTVAASFLPGAEDPTRISHQLLEGRGFTLPLHGLLDYSCVPRLAQPRCLGAARGAEHKEAGSRDFGGAEAPPFRQPPWRWRGTKQKHAGASQVSRQRGQPPKLSAGPLFLSSRQGPPRTVLGNPDGQQQQGFNYPERDATPQSFPHLSKCDCEFTLTPNL
jgi:hypothetical protein